MSKNVVVLKDYKPNVLEMRKPPVKTRRLSPSAVIKPLADEIWEKSEDFRNLLTSIDASTSPSQWVVADKVDAVRFVIKYAEKNNRMLPEFPQSDIHKTLLAWAKENQVSRKMVKSAAKQVAYEALKAAE
jgi:hypothetical protein